VALPEAIFSDVDTQYDFIMPDGKLYVAGAESIIPNLQLLTNFARSNSIRVVGFVDAHSLEDPEISERPDFKETFPPHCIEGTPGQLKIDATKPLNPLWIENRPYPPSELKGLVAKHKGEIFLKKNRIAILPDENAERILKLLAPASIYVYGIALDFCVRFVIDGFLEMGFFEVKLVEDATKAIYPDKAEKLIEDWRKRGVEIIRTEDVVKRPLRPY